MTWKFNILKTIKEKRLVTRASALRFPFQFMPFFIIRIVGLVCLIFSPVICLVSTLFVKQNYIEELREMWRCTVFEIVLGKFVDDRVKKN